MDLSDDDDDDDDNDVNGGGGNSNTAPIVTQTDAMSSALDSFYAALGEDGDSASATPEENSNGGFDRATPTLSPAISGNASPASGFDEGSNSPGMADEDHRVEKKRKRVRRVIYLLTLGWL